MKIKRRESGGGGGKPLNPNGKGLKRYSQIVRYFVRVYIHFAAVFSVAYRRQFYREEQRQEVSHYSFKPFSIYSNKTKNEAEANKI